MFRAPENLYHIGQKPTSTSEAPEKVEPVQKDDQNTLRRQALEADLRKLGLYKAPLVNR